MNAVEAFIEKSEREWKKKDNKFVKTEQVLTKQFRYFRGNNDRWKY